MRVAEKDQNFAISPCRLTFSLKWCKLTILSVQQTEGSIKVFFIEKNL